MQLVLPVLQAHDYRLDNFIAADNLALIEHVKAAISSESNSTSAMPITYIQGAQGVGKTHLLLGFHHFAETEGLISQYIDMAQVRHLPAEIMQDLGAVDVICVDNLDLIHADMSWQVQVFNAINAFIERGAKQFIVSASNTATQAGFTLPDLVSRLQWGTTFSVHELGEARKVEALQMHFCERGINVQNEVIIFLMRRCQRDMHKLIELVDQLDKLSLQKHRKLTIPFVKESLSL